MAAVVAQGDVCWVQLDPPVGSAPGYRRPAIVVQGDAFNRSRIATVVCVPLTTNVALAHVPGNVLLPPGSGGLTRESVANPSQIFTADRSQLDERIGRVSRRQLDAVFAGIDLVLGRERPGE